MYAKSLLMIKRNALYRILFAAVWCIDVYKDMHTVVYIRMDGVHSMTYIAHSDVLPPLANRLSFQRDRRRYLRLEL